MTRLTLDELAKQLRPGLPIGGREGGHMIVGVTGEESGFNETRDYFSIAVAKGLAFYIRGDTPARGRRISNFVYGWSVAVSGDAALCASPAIERHDLSSGLPPHGDPITAGGYADRALSCAPPHVAEVLARAPQISKNILYIGEVFLFLTDPGDDALLAEGMTNPKGWSAYWRATGNGSAGSPA